MKKRIFSLLLAALMLCPLAACAVDEGAGDPATTTAAPSVGQADTTTEAPETEPKYLDNIPEDLRYDGQTINILQRTAHVKEMKADEITGEIVNDAIYERNRAVEDRFGITFAFHDAEGTNTSHNIYAGVITNSINAQDNAFQIIANYAYYGISLCQQGIYLNLHSIENLDLEQPWWNQDYIEEATVKNKMYYVVGDATPSAIERLVVTFVNRDLAKQYYPDLDLYQLAREGKWTVDKQMELAKTAYQDLDGNAAVDATDFFGLVVARKSVPIDALMASWEITATKKNAAGDVEMALNTEHNIAATEKMLDLFFHSDGVYGKGSNGDARSKFASGEAIFTYDMMNQASTTLREVTFDYGIMPLPKYTEAQEAYHTTSHDEYSALSVPVTVPDAEMVGAVLEVMGAESYRKVRPVIFETAYKTKYLNDEASAQMFDYIVDGAVYDFGYIYSNLINNPVHQIRYQLYNFEDNTGLSAKLKMNDKLCVKTLAALVEKFDELP
ncbi:MAG: hypothetical protein IJX53_05615 [Clostridia bacterium]|nr:hypothetical protein [Clostridia bacterium]